MWLKSFWNQNYFLTHSFGEIILYLKKICLRKYEDYLGIYLKKSTSLGSFSLWSFYVLVFLCHCDFQTLANQLHPSVCGEWLHLWLLQTMTHVLNMDTPWTPPALFYIQSDVGVMTEAHVCTSLSLAHLFWLLLLFFISGVS